MKKIFLILIFLFVNLFLISGYSSSSSNYQTDVIYSSGGGTTNSSTYYNNVVVGTISGKTNSSNYQTSLGFFHGTGSVVGNLDPTNPTVSINSSDGSDYPTQNLNCFATISDGDGDNLDVYVRWYRDGNLRVSQNFEDNYPSGTNFNAVLLSSNISAGEVWNCEMLLYDGKTYSSWVSSPDLTILSIPSSTPPTGDTGGGGGGVSTIYSFSLDKDLIKTTVRQSYTKRETIEIKNTGNQKLDFVIELEGIEDFTAISEESFSLNAGDSKIINLDFFAKENEIPDAYTGRIVVKGGGITKNINVILEVKERKPLFDVITDVKDKRVSPGEELEFNVRLINFGDLENFDVLFYYAIKDFEDNVITFKEESLAIEKELDLDRTLEIPLDMEYGDYIFYARVLYDDVSAVGTETIKIVEKKSLVDFTFLMAMWILIVAITILVIVIIRRRKEDENSN